MRLETLLWTVLVGAAMAFGMKAGEWAWHEYTSKVDDIRYGAA